MAVGSTRGKRRLGREVKKIRLRAGLKPEQVAKASLCSRQTVTRMESGDSLPRIHLFMMILNVIGATEAERARAQQLWEVADADMAVIEHELDLPAKYRRFRLDESEASRERTLDTVIIPGLLQTPEYASAISHGRRRLDSTEEWESRAAAERRERQALLTRPREPLSLHALIDEGALGRVIGSPGVTAAQLDRLVSAASEPNVHFQVIPKGFGAHGAMSGPLFLLSFPEDDEPDEAYVESVTGMETVGNHEDVAALSAVWDEIAGAAPSIDRSVEIIQAVRDSVKG